MAGETKTDTGETLKSMKEKLYAEAEAAYERLASEARINKALLGLAEKQFDAAAGVGEKVARTTIGQRSESNLRNITGKARKLQDDYKKNVDIALERLHIEGEADRSSANARKAAEQSMSQLSQRRFNAELGLQQQQVDAYKSDSDFNKAYKLYIKRYIGKDKFKSMTGITVKNLPVKKKKTVKPLIIQLKPTDTATKSPDPDYTLISSTNPDTSVTKYLVHNKLIEDAGKTGVAIKDSSGRLRDERVLRRDIYGEGVKPAVVLDGTANSAAIAKDADYVKLAFSDSNGRATTCYVKKDVYEFAKGRGIDLDVNGAPKSNMQLMRDLFGIDKDGTVDYSLLAQNLKDGGDMIIDMFGIEDYSIFSAYASYRAAYAPLESAGLGDGGNGLNGIPSVSETAALDDLVMNSQAKKALLGDDEYYRLLQNGFDALDAQFARAADMQQDILDSGNAYSRDDVLKTLPEYESALVYADTDEDKLRKAMGLVPESFNIENFESIANDVDAVKQIFGGSEESAWEYVRKRIAEDGTYRPITDEEIEREEAKIGELDDAAVAARREHNPYEINTSYATEEERQEQEQIVTDAENAWKYQQEYVRWLRTRRKNDKIEQKEKAAANAPDFEEYAAKGAALENPEQDFASGIVVFGWKPFQAEIKNKVTYGRENFAYLALESINGSTDPDARYMKYKYMTDDEVDVHNYILAKEGKDAADDYLDLLEEALNYRMGMEQAGGIKDEPLLQYLYGFGSGLEQFGQGFRQLFSEEALPTSATAFAAQQIRKDLADDGPKLPDWLGGGSLGQTAFDVLQTTGNMAPSILLTYVTAGLGAPAALSTGVGAISMGTSAKGNAYKWALDAGYSKGQAGSYSTLIGLSEGGLQYLLGGIAKLGGRISGKAIGTVISNIDNSLLRASADLALHGLSEGAEEYLQDILEPIYRNIAFDENNEFRVWTPEATYDFMLGALTAGMLDGPSGISQNISSDKAGQAVLKAKKYDELIQNALGLSPKTEAYRMALKMSEDKTNANNINVGELLKQYIDAKGDITFMYTPGREPTGAGTMQADVIGDIALKLQGISSRTGLDIYDQRLNTAYLQYGFEKNGNSKASESAANFLSLAERNIGRYITPDGMPIKGVDLNKQQAGEIQDVRMLIRQAISSISEGSGVSGFAVVNGTPSGSSMQGVNGNETASESALPGQMEEVGEESEKHTVEGEADEGYNVNSQPVGTPGEYYAFAGDIAKRPGLTVQQKLAALKEAYYALGEGNRKDVRCPADAKYLKQKGFDENGYPLYDWPEYIGYDPKTIKPVTRTQPLPEKLDRVGPLGGSNFSDVPNGRQPYTNDERSLPDIENPEAYHAGDIENGEYYFSAVDAIRNNNIDALNHLLKEKGIESIDAGTFKRMYSKYNQYISNLRTEVGDIDAAYGIWGIAAQWADKASGEVYLPGGATQFTTPLSGEQLVRLGIFMELEGALR